MRISDWSSDVCSSDLIGNRSTIARAFPIGIDHDEFMALGETGIARRSQQRLGSSARKRTIAIGVDRLDYSKGLPERIDALERLFSGHAEMVNQLLFVQIAPPSRQDVPPYQPIPPTPHQKHTHEEKRDGKKGG